MSVDWDAPPSPRSASPVCVRPRERPETRSLTGYTGRAARPPTTTYWPWGDGTERPDTSGVFADSRGNVVAKGRLYPSMSRLGMALTCRRRGTRPAPRSTGVPRRRSAGYGPFDPVYVRGTYARETDQGTPDCGHHLFYFYSRSLHINHRSSTYPMVIIVCFISTQAR